MCALLAEASIIVLMPPALNGPPNGLRLSCGRNAGGRKTAEPQTKRLASEATQFLLISERPPSSVRAANQSPGGEGLSIPLVVSLRHCGTTCASSSALLRQPPSRHN